MTKRTAAGQMALPTHPYEIPVYRIQLVRDSNAPAMKKITGPQDAGSIFKSYLAGADRENFVVMMLDTQNQVIGLSTISVGTLNSTVVAGREVFKPAILSNAAAIVLCHNHPSGITNPSQEDLAITRRLVAAGELLEIKVLDHVIIDASGDGATYSFSEHGVLTA